METPTSYELRKLCDLLCDKACTLADVVEAAGPLQEWQARGCESALGELHTKMDRMLEIISRQPQVFTG